MGYVNMSKRHFAPFDPHFAHGIPFRGPESHSAWTDGAPSPFVG